MQTLLTELDEVAVKQGEEEIKKLETRLKSPVSANYSGKRNINNC